MVVLARGPSGFVQTLREHRVDLVAAVAAAKSLCALVRFEALPERQFALPRATETPNIDEIKAIVYISNKFKHIDRRPKSGSQSGPVRPRRMSLRGMSSGPLSKHGRSFIVRHGRFGPWS